MGHSSMESLQRNIKIIPWDGTVGYGEYSEEKLNHTTRCGTILWRFFRGILKLYYEMGH